MSLREIDSDSDRLIIQADLPDVAPERAFEYFVEPRLLTSWWATEAEGDRRTGGWYHYSWPAQNWHLRGRFTRYEEGRGLGFTWQWDHEPDLPMRHVDIDIDETDAGGSLVTVTHALYGTDTPEQEDRDSHREGWLHFLSRLQEVAAADEASA